MRMLHNKTFKRFMLSYIIVLLLPLCIMAYSYTKSTDIIERNAIESSIFKLNNFKDMMDSRIERIDKNIMELSQNEKLARIVKLPKPISNTPDMYWYEDFYNYFNGFSFYSSADKHKSFLFISHNDVVYGNRYLNFSRREFYDDYFQFEGMTYEEWSDLFFSRRYYAQFLPAQDITIQKDTGLYIPYLYSLPAISGANQQDTSRIHSTIVYLLNVDDIYDLIANSLSGSGGETYILGTGGFVLASTDNQQGRYLDLGIQMIQSTGVHEIRYQGRQVLAIYVHSDLSGLTHVSLLPLDVIRADMYELRDIVVLIWILALLLGLFVSLFLSYRNTLPVTHLLSANHNLQEKLDLQRRSIEILYIDKLLKNDFASKDELALCLKHVGLPPDNNRYRVVYIRLLPDNAMITDAILREQDIYRAVIESMLRQEDVIHNLSHNEIAIIAPCRQEEDEIIAMIHRMQGAFAQRFSFTPLFAVGEAYASPSELHNSLREAQTAADFSDTLMPREHILWYRDVNPSDTLDLFGREHEQVLLNLIRQGDAAALEAHLNMLFQGSSYRTMSANMRRLYLSHLHAVLLRLAEDSSVAVDRKELDKWVEGKRRDYFEALKKSYLQLCAQLDSTKKSRNQKLRDSILAYLNENYCDSELSVALLAGHFNLTESYFSQFFREQVGEPFSRYLERLRINHARKLLSESFVSVDETARRSGYNNTNTFRRAFKRITGVLPSSYSGDRIS